MSDTTVERHSHALQAVRASMPQVVAEAIRALILDGTLRPGQRIHQEEMARRLGVSATPVREALRQLAVEQFVTVAPQRGVFVAELSADDIEEIYLMRDALEGFAARLAAANLSATDVARLEDHLERMKSAARRRAVQEFLGADRAFHAVVFGAAHRRTLEQKIFHLWDNSTRAALSVLSHPEMMDFAIRMHQEILDACRAHDADLLALKTRQHTMETSRRVIDDLRRR